MKVAIAGFGVEGRASYDYWQSKGDDVTIVDEHTVANLPPGATVVSGEDAFSELDSYDLVVRTASLDPLKIKTTGRIWSATNEFFAVCPAPIVGVTGTKGKGTTASLIASILRAGGKAVHLLGNIGVPALEVLPTIQANDIVVYELSSFQLWDIEKSPEVAVVLLVEPDHLNVHHDLNDYVQAKARIGMFQTGEDLCVYHPTNPLSAQIAQQSTAGAHKRYAYPEDGGVYEKEGFFYQDEHKICSIQALQLLGRHNIENACAALTVAKQYGIDDRAIEAGLNSFKGLPHRLEFVRNHEGVMYYNDSFSSAPSATCAAIASFTQPEILILGGTDKGADFSQLISQLHDADNIKQIVLIGEIRRKLASLLETAGVTHPVKILDETTMKAIISYVGQIIRPGDVVLLSPACASFDMFENFYDRGDQFRQTVLDL